MPLSPDWFESIREEAGAENMKAPTEEQLRDPAWWDENAPEGATHFIDPTGTAFDEGEGGKFCEQMETGAYWILPERECFWPDATGVLCVARPAKPKPQAWGVIEAELHEGEGQWYEAVVIGKTLDGAKKVIEWVDTAMSKHSVDALPDSRIRPIRTKEQQDQARVERIILDTCGTHIFPRSDFKKLAEALIADGFRREGAE